MKICIVGDLHFGASFSLGKIDQNRQLNSRLIDFSNTFDYVVDYLISNDIKHLILCGDIFEHQRPQAAELAIFAEKMSHLSDKKIHTHVVIGNHDIILDQRSTTMDALKSLHLPFVHIYPDIEYFHCGEGGDGINFFFMPFRTKQALNCSTNETAVQRLRDVLEYEFGGMENNDPKILVGHFMLQGTVLGNVVINTHPGEIVLPLNMFDDLDAVIMGHVHSHQIIKKEPFITYIGSMERKDFGEAEREKYFLIIEQNKKLSFQFEKLPVRNLFDINIDQKRAKTSEDALINIKKFIDDFGNKKSLFGSIVRINIFINEVAASGLNTHTIVSYLRKQHLIHHCVGVYFQLTAKRQLRKSSITEKLDPIHSFNEYLDLETDTKLKEKMREIGLGIISRRTG